VLPLYHCLLSHCIVAISSAASAMYRALHLIFENLKNFLSDFCGVRKDHGVKELVCLIRPFICSVATHSCQSWKLKAADDEKVDLRF